MFPQFPLDILLFMKGCFSVTRWPKGAIGRRVTQLSEFRCRMTSPTLKWCRTSYFSYNHLIRAQIKGEGKYGCTPCPFLLSPNIESTQLSIEMQLLCHNTSGFHGNLLPFVFRILTKAAYSNMTQLSIYTTLLIMISGRLSLSKQTLTIYR